MIYTYLFYNFIHMQHMDDFVLKLNSNVIRDQFSTFTFQTDYSCLHA